MSYVDERSKVTLEQALHRAAKTCLVRDAADTCVVAPCRESPPAPAADDKLVLVTISSFRFRALVIFHIDEGPSLKAYFSGGDPNRSVEEALYEAVNMCCGALNRDMTRDFRHLAMSIPYTLGAACSAYLTDLHPEFVSSSIVTINDTVCIRLTLCLCCHVPVSFSATGIEPETTDSGALELF